MMVVYVFLMQQIYIIHFKPMPSGLLPSANCKKTDKKRKSFAVGVGHLRNMSCVCMLENAAEKVMAMYASYLLCGRLFSLSTRCSIAWLCARLSKTSPSL